MQLFLLLYKMNRFFIAQSLICVLFCSAAFAQQDEHWEAYMAKVDGKPASVLVDLGLIDHAPDTRLPYLVVTGPIAKSCDGEGLPDTAEIAKLEDILDASDNFITGLTPKVLAGTYTHNCQRLNYYYVKDTMGIRNAIGRMYNRNFPDCGFVISIRPDKEWRSYRTFLYPSEETFNWIENNKIILNLLEHGDDLTKQRNITFTLYFDKQENRTAFMEFAHKIGFDVVEMNFIKNGDVPYELKISKFTYVKSDIIGEMTTEIKNEAKKYNAVYNGWESEVIKH